MNSQSGPSSFLAKSLGQPKATAQTKASAKGKRKEQRDHHKTDRVDKSPERAETKRASKRGSGKQQSKKEKDSYDCESEDKPNETPAPKRGTINRQSKKQRNPEISESKYEENGASVPDNANNAAENERPGSAHIKKSDSESEGKPRKTVKSKSDKKSAPKQKSTAKPGGQHESDASSSQDASSPAVCAHSSDRQKKSAEHTATRGLKVDGALTQKVLKATLDKLKIKKNERSNASSCVNDITDKVIAHLKGCTTWCGEIERLRTGSYYENVKVSDWVCHLHF